MSTLDINLWIQKWHKLDPSQQRDFLLMQLQHSQTSSLQDIPLIMMSLITEHHLKAIASSAASNKTGTAASPTASNPPPNYALYNREYSFVTPDFILREVWAILKPTVNEFSPLQSPTKAVVHRPTTNLNNSTDYEQIESEFRHEETIRERIRKEAIQAMKDVSATRPNSQACDIMDGWSIEPHQLASKMATLAKAEDALIDVATHVVCNIKGINLDPNESVEEQNLYAKARPSVPKAVRWLAKRLLHSILGYDVMMQRHEKLIIENFDAQWNAVSPFATILNLLWTNWDQRKINNEVFPRAVLNECRQTCFHAALNWSCKECMIVGACANFSIVLFALWISPKWNLGETLPQSLVAARVYNQRKKVVPTGLLLDYLNVRSIYDDTDGESGRQQDSASDFIRMLIRHMTLIIDTHMPEMKHTLDLWALGRLEIPTEGNEDSTHPPPTAHEKLILMAVRSWLESLFTAATPHHSQYDVIRTDTRAQVGHPSPRSHSPQHTARSTTSTRPTSAMLLDRLQSEEMEGMLMGADNCSLFWRHFVAFGWPFVVKLALQILYEASSSQPLQIHAGSPIDLSAYAAAKGTQSTLSIYSSNVPPPLVTDPKLEGMLRKLTIPPGYRPMSLLRDFKEGPPDDYLDFNDLRVMQKAFMLAINRLPSSVTNLDGLIRRIDQWDQVLFESLRQEVGPVTADLVRKWDLLFISSQHSKKKTRSILQANGTEDDEMERIKPMAKPSVYL